MAFFVHKFNSKKDIAELMLALSNQIVNVDDFFQDPLVNSREWLTDIWAVNFFSLIQIKKI